MSNDVSLGQHLRRVRREKSLTQEAVAREVGIDTSYLSKIETDSLEHSPSIKTLARLAEVLSLDELDLMDRADKMPAAMRSLAATPAALRFLRRAATEVDSPEDWEALHRFLDDRRRDKP